MATTAMVTNLMKADGGPGSPGVSAAERKADQKVEDAKATEAKRAEEMENAGPVMQKFMQVMDVVNGTGLQTVLYLVFVVIFQSLSSTVRDPKEFYTDKHVMDRIVENHFDSSHNTFESVRRIADIYEWGNNVLWPGMFSDMGPCNENVGMPNKQCNDDTWPDGEGSFHGTDATPFPIEELVERMDMFDWTEGITIKQLRAAQHECSDTDQLGDCYPELDVGKSANTSFGFNWTTGQAAPLWRHYSVDELGSNPAGITSAAIPSMRQYSSDGYVAVVIPFFSDSYLQPQEGSPSDVFDFRAVRVTTTNGRTPRFYCVRLSLDASHIKQLCDPGANGDGTGAYTGAVRAAVEEMWNDLKRGHFLDSRSRVLTITLQLKSNHQGVRYRIQLMFEMTALGAILPSYDVETRILKKSASDGFSLYSTIALVMVIFFALLEGVELKTTGPIEYFQDMWNVMDWLNYLFYVMVYAQIRHTIDAIDNADCSSYLCSEVGYFDDWKVMQSFRQMKVYLSLCCCIQLFKILKFASLCVPKMGLATAVLRKCAMDLLFFGVTFIISMLAFSMMLFIQLGPVMASYWDQIPAFISLFRALFGDFDIGEILDNSSGYLNTLLFLGYLFVAIFIMLSMFLAILAEAQVEVREDEQARKKSDDDFNEYGVLNDAGNAIGRAVGALKERCMGSAEPASASRKESEEPHHAAHHEHHSLNSVMYTLLEMQKELVALRAEVALQALRAPQLPPASPTEMETTREDPAAITLSA